MKSLPFPIPSEDRVTSPYTGYTRAHSEAGADGLLDAAWKWATPGRALLDLPGRPSRSGGQVRRPGGLRPYVPDRRVPGRRRGAEGRREGGCPPATETESVTRMNG